jgi:hypothetical protein
VVFATATALLQQFKAKLCKLRHTAPAAYHETASNSNNHRACKAQFAFVICTPSLALKDFWLGRPEQ